MRRVTNIITLAVIGVITLGIIGAVYEYNTSPEYESTPTPVVFSPEIPTSTPSPSPRLTSPVPPSPDLSPLVPIAEFRERSTKKRYATYVTPSDSPVQPERFNGYHTGVDVEYGDTEDDVPVFVTLDGLVVQSRSVSGYGGLVIIRSKLNGKDIYVLYGHLRLSDAVVVGREVKRGERVGVLGRGYSEETDGERKHLHFAVYTGDPVDVRGYVQSRNELKMWIDPLSLYP